jgi:hypothetical protein
MKADRNYRMWRWIAGLGCLMVACLFGLGCSKRGSEESAQENLNQKDQSQVTSQVKTDADERIKAERKCKIEKEISKRGVLVDPFGRQPTDKDYEQANVIMRALSGFPEEESQFLDKLGEYDCIFRALSGEQAKKSIQQERQAFERKFFADHRNSIALWKGSIDKEPENVLRLKVRIAELGSEKLVFVQTLAIDQLQDFKSADLGKIAMSLKQDDCVVFSGQVHVGDESANASPVKSSGEYPIVFISLRACE